MRKKNPIPREKRVVIYVKKNILELGIGKLHLLRRNNSKIVSHYTLNNCKSLTI